MQLLYMVLLGAAAVLFPFLLSWLGGVIRDKKETVLPCLIMAADLALAVYALCVLNTQWW